MQENQVLMVSENGEFSENRNVPAQGSGMMPPNPRGTVFDPSAEYVLLGTVSIYVKGKVFAHAEGCEPHGRFDVSEMPRRSVRKEQPALCSVDVQRKAARVREFIFAHYASPLTVEEIAAHVHLTSRELGRVFRAQEGLSVQAFLENTRLERAAALLRGTNSSIAEIAVRVGFSCAAYFCRRFRNAYGMTPGHYRLKGYRGAKTKEG